MQTFDILKTESLGRQLSLSFACIVTIALLVWLFSSTAVSIEGIWSASETFTHGYFVLPVFFWLLWRQRQDLAQVQIQPDLLALVPLTGAGLLWLLSKLAGIQVGEQLAFVLILIFTLWGVMGRAMAGKLKFPLTFLIFLAPVGEEFVPHLMEITADMTVWAIRQTNIPVYREGLFFSLPSGNWSVVEACSGIRYLISSTVLGALYAYLSFDSTRLRIGFLAISVAVPIVANSMRAFLIVMLGHFSGNKLATGVDHLVYGWLFFGIVMFALFSIGGWLRQYDTTTVASTKSDMKVSTINSKTSESTTQRSKPVHSAQTLSGFLKKLSALLAVVAIVALWPIWFAATTQGSTAVNPQTLASGALTDGMIVDDSANPIASTATLWQPRNFGHDVRVERSFSYTDSKNGLSATVRAIAFVYQEQRQGKEMVSSRNVLVANSDDPWRLIQVSNRAIHPKIHSGSGDTNTNTNTNTNANANANDNDNDNDLKSATSIKESVLKGPNQQFVVWQWYRIGNTRTSSALTAKLVEVRNKLLLRDTVSVAYILATDANIENYELNLSDAMALIDSQASLR